jgi:FkbM family methyltransferase
VLTRLGRVTRRVVGRALTAGVRAVDRSGNELVRAARFDALGPEPRLGLVQDGEETYVVLSTDQIIARDLFLHGNRAHERITRALRHVGDDFRLRTLVDVGANIGIVSVSAVRRGLADRAIAIEPVPENYRLLVANIHLNGVADRIEHHAVALGSRTEEILRFELSPDNSGDHRVQFEGAGLFGEGQRARIDVRSTRFDDLVGDLEPRSSLIWMEAQGYEGHILEGASRAVHARVPVVAEFCPYLMRRSASYAAFVRAVESYRFWSDLSDEAPRRLPPSADSFDRLAKKLGDRGAYTDILIV